MRRSAQKYFIEPTRNTAVFASVPVSWVARSTKRECHCLCAVAANCWAEKVVFDFAGHFPMLKIGVAKRLTRQACQRSRRCGKHKLLLGARSGTFSMVPSLYRQREASSLAPPAFTQAVEEVSSDSTTDEDLKARKSKAVQTWLVWRPAGGSVSESVANQAAQLRQPFDL